MAVDDEEMVGSEGKAVSGEAEIEEWVGGRRGVEH